MDMALLFISALLAVANNCLLHTLSSRHIKYNAFFFNAAISLWWIPILIILNGGISVPKLPTVICGVLYGLCTSVFLLSKTGAMSTGPIAATTLIGSCSFIITTVFNAIYWHENVTWYRIVGIVLIIAAALLVTGGKNPDGKKPTKTWYLYVISFFFLAGVIGIVFRFHQSSEGAPQINEMMMISAATSAVILFALYIIKHKKTDGKPLDGKIAVIIMLAGGAACLGYNRLNVYLSGALESCLFFPLINGVILILTSLLGIFLFKEKLNRMKLFGMLLGVAAIFTISGFFGLIK